MVTSIPTTPIYRFNRDAKRAQLKADGRYPWQFALDQIRYATTPHLTKEQADKLLYAISGRGTAREDMAIHLADLRVEDIVLHMTAFWFQSALQDHNK